MYLFKDFELIKDYNMAVLRLELDNILCFNGFEADFSYPKKLVNTTLEGEYLHKYPFIRYKKVNIIIGSNASGKTSLGRAIWMILMFLRDKEAKPIKDLVTDPSKEATMLMDCVFNVGIFFRFEARIKTNGDVDVRYRSLKVNKLDTYESLIRRLPEDVAFENHVKALEKAVVGGWNFCFPTIEYGFDHIMCKYPEDKKEEFVSTFNNVLKTFDPSIDEVFMSKEQEDTYIIKFHNGKTTAIKDGEKISGLTLLSSGTKYAINIANVMCSIKNHANGFYYVDEQFSYANSEIEIACLNTMIELLGDGEQLFFTTHNEEIMSLPLPIHTFSFLKKTMVDDKYVIELLNASKFEKRNNVNVKNLYDNDYFDVAPDLRKVFEIGN